ncbi:MAG: glycosyltransferase family 9 protein [Prevotellaceae bacterium]|jgi:ADP-heptose:LPS heptosyltransferase|nr:glycosyltransferase family 9 protein [Prevotellaceae bacterium]
MEIKTNKRVPTCVLVLRFSALGDVAMVAATLHETAAACRGVEFMMVSQPFMSPLFKGSDNVSCIEADIHGRYKGLWGLWKLFLRLRDLRPDVVADLHDVLRTKVLRFFFRISGVKVKKIDKGRKEKRRLTRRRNKELRPLKTMIERYREILNVAVGEQEVKVKEEYHWMPVVQKGGGKRLGIAPFARYKGKCYPTSRMEKIVAYFATYEDIEVYLFGGGKEEVMVLSEWEKKYHVVSMAGKMPLGNELIELSCMDVMLSMDSANMHLASFAGVPVVSVWGATHPFAGFTGWKQTPENCVQIEMACRPCSVFGNRLCYRGDYACMNIPEELLIAQIEKNLFGKKENSM